MTAVRVWALNGLRWLLVAYLLVQGAAGLLVEHSAAIGVLFIVPGIACLTKPLHRMGFLGAALSQVVFIVGFQHDVPVYTVISQLFVAVCLAWFYAVQKYVD